MDSERLSNDELLTTCVSFLEEIGIEVRFETLVVPTFLPGLLIDRGSLVIDRSRLLYPGDLLHEAGHIAVVPAGERHLLNHDCLIEARPQRASEEMMAIAWSYAACVHLGIDPAFVFHDDGYKGGGDSIVENFSQGHYFGTPMLQWCGMTKAPLKDGEMIAEDSYPKMLSWLRN